MVPATVGRHGVGGMKGHRYGARPLAHVPVTRDLEVSAAVIDYALVPNWAAVGQAIAGVAGLLQGGAQTSALHAAGAGRRCAKHTARMFELLFVLVMDGRHGKTVLRLRKRILFYIRRSVDGKGVKSSQQR